MSDTDTDYNPATLTQDEADRLATMLASGAGRGQVEQFVNELLAGRLTPVPCEPLYEAPFDFASCLTHDTVFRVGGSCKFEGHDMIEVLEERISEQRGRALLIEIQLAKALDRFHDLADNLDELAGRERRGEFPPGRASGFSAASRQIRAVLTALNYEPPVESDGADPAIPRAGRVEAIVPDRIREQVFEAVYDAYRLGKFSAQGETPMWHEIPTDDRPRMPEGGQIIAAIQQLLDDVKRADA